MSSESPLPLYCFVGTTWLAVFAACGSISTTPAYEAALFGSRNVGAVHGRMLVFNSIAAVVGPNLFVRLRTNDEARALGDLLGRVEPARFEAAFGVPPSGAGPLIEAKTVSVAKLMELMPPGTSDPTPFLYDSTMHAMGGLVLVSAVVHNMIRPVDPRMFAAQPDAPDAPGAAARPAPAAGEKEAEGTGAGGAGGSGRGACAAAAAAVTDASSCEGAFLGGAERPMPEDAGGAKRLADECRAERPRDRAA